MDPIFYWPRLQCFLGEHLEGPAAAAILAAMPYPRRHLLVAAAHLGALACARQVAVDAAAPAAATPNPAPKDANVPIAKPKARVTVDLTHDVVCPWCRIGHHNLRTALTDLADVDVEVRLHPFLLNP
ncbi:MAG: DsbA family protein, partial [Deltaproteobacteria bacterium]|nr:DsbA family protein [Deltaproteobacteria bacterium]